MGKEKLLKLTICISIFMLGHCGYSDARHHSIKNSRLIVTSIPKTGTFLLDKCVRLIAQKEPVLVGNPLVESEVKDMLANHFFLGHIPLTYKNKKIIENNRCRGLFIYRDPRDQLVSLAFWVQLHPDVWPEDYKLDFDTLLLKLITNCLDIYTKFIVEPKCTTVAAAYRLFLPWRKATNCYSTTFEKLVGPRGGGSRELQLREINNIARHMGMTLSDRALANVADNLFGETFTFRLGQIGSWKNYFKEEHKKAFKEVAPRLLLDLGYEKGHNW